MVKFLNIGKNISKSIYHSISRKKLINQTELSVLKIRISRKFSVRGRCRFWVRVSGITIQSVLYKKTLHLRNASKKKKISVRFAVFVRTKFTHRLYDVFNKLRIFVFIYEVKLAQHLVNMRWHWINVCNSICLVKISNFTYWVTICWVTNVSGYVCNHGSPSGELRTASPRGRYGECLQRDSCLKIHM